MGKDYDQSLGEQRTLEGGALADTDSQSLGDQATQGDVSASSPAPDNLDGIEIVDLSARYTIETTLGKGGMGEVLLAFDTRLRRKVAIKRVLGDLAGNSTVVSRFLTEAQSIAALNHQHIVQIYDYGRDKDGPFLILEYVDGSNLQVRSQKGPLPAEEALELTCQLCDGLSKAHKADIIHRDIKPANILLTKDGIPKLTDFGLARDETADTGMTKMGTVLGTLDFMPPEQRRDATLADTRSDLWSLAATLYQMVTGKSPRIIKFDNMPTSLRDVMSKALEEDSNDRYQSADEFRDALHTCLSAPSPQPVLKVDLDTGQCAECQTSNPFDRKFCRECAAPLRINCIQCGVEIPVWDKACGECGGKQAELITGRQLEMDQQRAKAEESSSRFEFDKALAIARAINNVKESQLQHLKVWSGRFIESTQTEKLRQEQNRAGHFAEAKTHREAYDYPAAIGAMQAIPDEMCTAEMASYLKQLQSDHQESETLIASISEVGSDHDSEELISQLERVLELRPDRSDLLERHVQLIERRDKHRQRDETYSEAQTLLSEGQAAQALACIERIAVADDLATMDLKKKLEKIVLEENKVYSLLASYENGITQPHEVVEFLGQVDDYLTLNPTHSQFVTMRKDLFRLIEEAPRNFTDYGIIVTRHMISEFAERNMDQHNIGCPVCNVQISPGGLLEHFDSFHERLRGVHFIKKQDYQQMDNATFKEFAVFWLLFRSIK